MNMQSIHRRLERLETIPPAPEYTRKWTMRETIIRYGDCMVGISEDDDDPLTHGRLLEWADERDAHEEKFGRPSIEEVLQEFGALTRGGL